MSATPIPNNLGPTLLLVLALLLLPLGIGLPLLLLSLAQVRTWQGQPALPRLHRSLPQLTGVWTRFNRLPLLPSGRVSGR